MKRGDGVGRARGGVERDGNERRGHIKHLHRPYAVPPPTAPAEGVEGQDY